MQKCTHRDQLNGKDSFLEAETDAPALKTATRTMVRAHFNCSTERGLDDFEFHVIPHRFHNNRCGTHSARPSWLMFQGL